ncbi:MAG: hypothetical protein OXU20_16715 [Myxococcales bacterium]|nr:hypothetical protein [Myxococcales bacterium]
MSTSSDPGPTPACLSALAIDEWNAGETPSAMRAAHAAHIEDCAHCAARLAAATAEAEAFLQDAPTLAALREGLARPTPRGGAPGDHHAATVRRLPRIAAVTTAGLALAAAVMLMVRPRLPEDGTRTKGSARLGVYVKRDGRVKRAANGDVVHPGDTLRFTYTSQAPRHLSVWGDDGQGLTRYHPAPGAEVAQAEPGRDVPLDFGIELDGALGTEVFYGVFCQPRVTADAIRAALERTPPSPPRDCLLDVIRLPKEPAP